MCIGGLKIYRCAYTIRPDIIANSELNEPKCETNHN